MFNEFFALFFVYFPRKFQTNTSCLRLSNEFVWDWCQCNWHSWILQGVSFARLLWLTFDRHPFSSFFGRLDFAVVFLNTANELVTALGFLDMLHANVDSFWYDSATNTLVDNHTQCTRCYVEHATSFTMVSFVRHSFVNSSVDLMKKNIWSAVFSKPKIVQRFFNSMNLSPL